MIEFDNALLAAKAGGPRLRIFTPEEQLFIGGAVEPSDSSLVGTGTVGLMIVGEDNAA